MYWIFITILAYSFFRGVRGLIRIVTSHRYISRQIGNYPHKNIFFHILIPVLREQKIIIDTVNEFMKIKGNFKLYLITTQKEDYDKKHNLRIPLEYKKLPTTKEILEKFIRLNTKLKDKIEIIHYPFTKGVMAHQLNFALRHIKDRTNQNHYVIVYNADSRIDPDILTKYSNVIFKNRPSECNVILQPSIFLANFNKLSGFLRSVALLQTRWTLAHEIPRVLRTNGKFGFTEGAHVVGHGLCLNYDFISKLGGFPQEFLNEDLPLGYYIRLNGAKIHLLNNLENADSPNSIRSMFNMYRTWFYGVLFYPAYIKKASQNKKFNKFFVYFWGLKYCLRGILWLFSSATWIFLFTWPILESKYNYFWLSLLSFILYAPASFFLIYIILGKKYHIEFKLTPILLSPITYFTHSIGPIMAIFDVLKSKVLGTSIYKNKTER